MGEISMTHDQFIREFVMRAGARGMALSGEACPEDAEVILKSAFVFAKMLEDRGFFLPEVDQGEDRHCAEGCDCVKVRETTEEEQAANAWCKTTGDSLHGVRETTKEERGSVQWTDYKPSGGDHRDCPHSCDCPGHEAEPDPTAQFALGLAGVGKQSKLNYVLGLLGFA